MAKKSLVVETLTHDEASRRNAPTAELEAFVPPDVKAPIRVAYERRNRDLDPQLVWRGKDAADWSDLIVEAPPLYIQEKIHPKALIADLQRASERRREPEAAPDLFADFNGIEPDQRTEFYAHDQHWSNRMILGDSLKVMASLAEREGLKGQVQCIYIDPPYGIKFNSNFQWSTTSRDVKDGKTDHFSREPEQVKAFRDTWADGIHSYLTYLRDRLTVARDLLTERGSVFVQIGDENVHRVRALMDEVFGDENFISEITVQKAGSTFAEYLGGVADYLIWFAKDRTQLKYRPLYDHRRLTEEDAGRFTLVRLEDGRLIARSDFDGLPRAASLVAPDPLQSASAGRDKGEGAASWFPVNLNGKVYRPTMQSRWKTNQQGMDRLWKANRLIPLSNSIRYARSFSDFSVSTRTNIWSDLSGAADKLYVVQTTTSVVARCLSMTTDPGDLTLDPTCGSGTTAYVAEQWGRRWITIDTSRVALALARMRIMSARYPWYLLADSREGQVKEGEVTLSVPAKAPTYGRIRQGFVYRRVPHITLKSIANDAEVDTVWEKWQAILEPLREAINGTLGTSWQEWEIPRKLAAGRAAAAKAHVAWWAARIARQKEIDASIAAKAETEYLYDQPFDDKSRVRVAGPFTVESLSPHRVPAVDADDSLFDELDAAEGRRQPGVTAESVDFSSIMLENLNRSGVQQAHKADRLVFSSLKPWPGRFICAQGTVRQASEGESDSLANSPIRRAAILVGPEYGTVAHADLTAAAREAMEAGFDLLIAAAFNFDAHASEFNRMGTLTVLQARINPDLHMPDLASTGAGNLFTVFGEPDIQVHDEADRCISIELAGVDMYKGGEIVSSGPGDIAVWFIDTDYNYESFFVRHAYFPERPLQGASDHAEGGDRRGCLGEPKAQPLAPVPAPARRQGGGKGHQPSRRRGDEGGRRVKGLPPYGRMACTLRHPDRRTSFDATVIAFDHWRIAHDPLSWSS